MKAITYTTDGPLEALVLRDVPTPAVKDGEVLVRVRAASLAIGDVFSVKGAPYAMRMYTGLLKPKWGVPGYDLAGAGRGGRQRRHAVPAGRLGLRLVGGHLSRPRPRLPVKRQAFEIR